jgi:hypothetical protein
MLRATQTRRDEDVRIAVTERVQELTVWRPLPSVMAKIGRISGVTRAIMNGTVGNRTWGFKMRGYHNGRFNALHDVERLRRQAPAASQAARIARERKQARQQWEREHPLT